MNKKMWNNSASSYREKIIYYFVLPFPLYLLPPTNFFAYYDVLTEKNLNIHFQRENSKHFTSSWTSCHLSQWQQHRIILQKEDRFSSTERRTTVQNIREKIGCRDDSSLWELGREIELASLHGGGRIL